MMTHHLCCKDLGARVSHSFFFVLVIPQFNGNHLKSFSQQVDTESRPLEIPVAAVMNWRAAVELYLQLELLPRVKRESMKVEDINKCFFSELEPTLTQRNQWMHIYMADKSDSKEQDPPGFLSENFLFLI